MGYYEDQEADYHFGHPPEAEESPLNLMNNPTPKYQIGQEVWRMHNNKIKNEEIRGLFLKSPSLSELESGIVKPYYVYTFSKFDFAEMSYEKDLFPTKQSLIDSL